MELEKIVSELGLDSYEGEYRDGSYMIELDNSDDFGDIFNLVSTYESMEPDDDSTATKEKSHFIFSDGYYEVELKGDFDNDLYSVVVRER